jgi:DNA uptake protein ComE-like DNA-binding protein
MQRTAPHISWLMQKRSTVKFFALVLVVILTSGLLAACGATTSAPVGTATTAPASPTDIISETTTATMGVMTTTETTATGETTVPVESVITESVAMTKFNINTVTPEEILTIPNTGNRMVREFEEYRPYVSIQQFRQEIGKYVDEAQVAEYEQYIYVPISANDSDAATLQQLPGVDETVAAALIAGRPYASNEAFLAALAQQVSPEQLAGAEGYLESE